MRSLPRPEDPPLKEWLGTTSDRAGRLIYAAVLLGLGEQLWWNLYGLYDRITGMIKPPGARRALTDYLEPVVTLIVRRPLFALFDEASKRVVSEVSGLPRRDVGGLSWAVRFPLDCILQRNYLGALLVELFRGGLEPFVLVLSLRSSLDTAVMMLPILKNPTLLAAVMMTYHAVTAVLPLPVAMLIRSVAPAMVCRLLLPDRAPEVLLNALSALLGALALGASMGVW